MTYEQLRRAFDRTSTLADQAARFRNDRLGKIISGQIWRAMRDGPICAVHFIPLTAMAGLTGLDVRKIYSDYVRFMFSDWGGASATMNFDGVVVHRGGAHERSNAHTQIFRNGAFEALRTGAAVMMEPTRKIIASLTVSQFYRDAMEKFLTAAREAGLAGPAVCGIALLNVTDYKFGYSDGVWGNEFPADRSDLVLPLGWLDDFAAERLDPFVQAQLDILWQAFGLDRCLFYTEQGAWRPR